MFGIDTEVYIATAVINTIRVSCTIDHSFLVFDVVWGLVDLSPEALHCLS